jgi:hypothetical protein
MGCLQHFSGFGFNGILFIMQEKCFCGGLTPLSTTGASNESGLGGEWMTLQIGTCGLHIGSLFGESMNGKRVVN